jgi:hypothetical protein
MSKDGTPPGSAKPAPPRFVLLAVGALVLTGLAALVSAFGLYGGKKQLLANALVANKKLVGKKNHVDPATLPNAVDKAVTSVTIQAVVLLLAVGLIGWAALRGRYWARWAVLGLWVISTLTGTPGGISSLLSVGIDAPGLYKAAGFVAGLAFVAAVMLTSLRRSVEYFNLSKPPRAAGGAQRRGLFAPRPAGGAAPRSRFESRTPAATRPATTRPETQPDRSRSKQRANTEAAVAKGAELARSRAKASKSRRSGT